MWICYILSCREKHTRHIQASSLDQGISKRFLVPTMAITFCCISGTSTRKIPTQRKTISGRMTTTTQQLQHKQTSQGSSSQPLKKNGNLQLQSRTISSTILFGCDSACVFLSTKTKESQGISGHVELQEGAAQQWHGCNTSFCSTGVVVQCPLG